MRTWWNWPGHWVKRWALGVEIDESELNVDMTIGELWRFAVDLAENAEM